MSSLSTLTNLRPARARGMSSLSRRSWAEVARPPAQVIWALMPSRAALKKLVRAASNSMVCSMRRGSSARLAIMPKKNAALATSSSTVGPEGRTRFSMRRWAFWSSQP